MNNNHKKAVLSAALVAGVALGVGGTAAPALADTGSGVHAPTGAATTGAATTSATGEAATPQSAPGNTAPVTVSRISVATGSQAGGTRITAQGSTLATDPSSGGEVPYSKPTVPFTTPATTRGGRAITATAAPGNVTVVSPGTIRVVTPSIPLAG